MASTASTSLRLELMATGENDTTWGTKNNTNLGMLENAIAGTTAISTTGGTTTLTNVDYTDDQAKKAVLDVSGVLVSNATIVIPNASRLYRVFNRTTGSFTLTIKTASGSGILVTQSTVAEIYCNASDVVRYTSPITDYTTGAPATSSGAAASSVSVTPAGNLSSSNAQAALAELQGDIDTINTALVASYQPLDADLTAIAAVTTAAYGRNILTYASEAAFKAGVNLEASTDFYAPGGTDVAVADGGTGASTATAGFNALSPTTTRGDLITRDASNNVRLAVGAANRVLRSDGTDPSWGQIVNSDITDATIAHGKLASAVTASQAVMETGTATDSFVSPGRQHFHVGHPKAGGNFDGSGTPAFRSGDYGMGGITDNGTGDYTLALDTAFANTNYWLTAWCRSNAATPNTLGVSAGSAGTKTTSSMQVFTGLTSGSSGQANDSSEVGISFWGDYA